MSNIQSKELNLSVAHAGGVQAFVDMWTYQVPQGARLIVTHFANYMGVADWGQITWRILRNSVPVPPYETVLDQIGISTLPRVTEPIVCEGGDLLQIQFSAILASVANDIGFAIRYEVG